MKVSEFASGLQHIGIPSKDLDETILFFTEIGFDIAHTNKDPNNGARVVFMNLGNLMIEAYESDEAAMKIGAIEHIAIDVTDIEAVYDVINKHGLNNTKDEIHFLPYWENGVRFFTIEGPDKEKVEFSQKL